MECLADKSGDASSISGEIESHPQILSRVLIMLQRGY